MLGVEVAEISLRVLNCLLRCPAFGVQMVGLACSRECVNRSKRVRFLHSAVRLCFRGFGFVSQKEVAGERGILSQESDYFIPKILALFPITKYKQRYQSKKYPVVHHPAS